MKEFVRKQKHLHTVDRTKVKDFRREVRDDIDIIIDEARKLGYSSVLEYVKATFTTFDGEARKHILSEVYNDFLNAVQEGSSKEPWSIGRWGSNSTFSEYLFCRIKEAESRLEELEWKKQTQYPSFAGLAKVLPHMENAPKGMGEGMSQEDYEFYKLIYRKSKELFEECLKNPVIIDDLLKSEIESKGSKE